MRSAITLTDCDNKHLACCAWAKLRNVEVRVISRMVTKVSIGEMSALAHSFPIV